MGTLKDKAKRFAAAFDSVEILADEAARARKAEKIRAVLAAEGIASLRGRTVLDIGCSFGVILSRLLSGSGGFGVGADIDEAIMRAGAGDIARVCCDAESLPFRSHSVDVVICNHIYEHTDHPERMIDEIERVLAPGGLCYFAGPSKYDPVEPHYRLPLLSWLPRRLADAYVRAAGKGARYDAKPYSYFAMKRMLGRFELTDYTPRILADPGRYHATDMLAPSSLKHRAAIATYRCARFVFPSFVFVLRKPVTSGDARACAPGSPRPRAGPAGCGS